MSTVSQKLTFDEAIVQCTDTLHAKHSAENSLYCLLQIVGEYYEADSCYIFEFDENSHDFSNNFYWHHPDTDAIVTEFGSLPFSVLEYFSEGRVLCEETGVMTFDTREFPDLPASKFFSHYDIVNIMIFPIVRRGSTTGFVGVTNIDLVEFDSRLFPSAVLFIQECLQKRELQLQLSILNNLDPLTGFFNQVQYHKKLKTLEEKMPDMLGVLFIQLTGLEKNNDFYGAKYVDMKVKNAAKVMGKLIDAPFYRIGEHKFISFILNVEEEDFLDLIDRMRLETSVNSNACFTVGYTWNQGALDIHEEIERSNHGLSGYLEKEAHPNVDLHSPSDCLLEDLMDTILRGDFLVYMQPKVELATQDIVGAEALVRRCVNDGELVLPDTFVPIYEHHNLIRHLDFHVLHQVCQKMREWKHFGVEIPVSVNFSRVTLLEEGVAKEIADICLDYEVSAHLVHIEITERLGNLWEDFNHLVENDFKSLGLKLILDDFGSTYSNFLTLSKVDIGEVKIDHSLVKDVENNPKNQKILKTIIDMCKSIGNTTSLAEGLETPAQTEILKDLDCTYGQGFFFSIPMPMDEFFEKYLRK